LPIPGTATPAHLEANVAAATLQLDQEEIDAISAAAGLLGAGAVRKR
jgi:aryl-alcohol dehydrogenase-like predicted oxidoreductase